MRACERASDGWVRENTGGRFDSVTAADGLEP